MNQRSISVLDGHQDRREPLVRGHVLGACVLVEPSSSLDELEPEPELAEPELAAHTLRAGLLRGPR